MNFMFSVYVCLCVHLCFIPYCVWFSARHPLLLQGCLDILLCFLFEAFMFYLAHCLYFILYKFSHKTECRCLGYFFSSGYPADLKLLLKKCASFSIQLVWFHCQKATDVSLANIFYHTVGSVFMLSEINQSEKDKHHMISPINGT